MQVFENELNSAAAAAAVEVLMITNWFFESKRVDF
jgi:hypothetical protein